MNYPEPTLLSSADVIRLLQDYYCVKHVSIHQESTHGSIGFPTEKLIPSECPAYMYFEDDNGSITNIKKDGIISIIYQEGEMHEAIEIDLGDSKIRFVIMDR